MRRECVRAADVLAAMTAGREPRLESEELRQHADACEACREMVIVVAALRGERDRLRRSTTVPSAGLVWWRAQLRQHQQAALKATAPVTVVHAAAIIAALVLAVVLATSVAPFVSRPSLGGFMPSTALFVETSRSLTTEFPLLPYGVMLGATAWLILGPVALYFALRRD
jgi:predicted anti-sigma-YlaC factor YlaD